MRTPILHSTLRVLAIVLGITIASQAPARNFHTPTQYRTVEIAVTSVTDLSFFGITNNAVPVFSGMLRIPVTPVMTTPLFDGGDHDGDRGGDDDSTGGDDSLGGDHHHHGDPSNDTTGGGPGGPGHHDGDRDSTDAGNDTVGGGCGHHGSDSTGFGDRGGNDTVECGGHHGGHDGDDSTAVSDTNAHTLFGNSPQSIVVKSHGKVANVVLQFTNNLTTTVKISSIALASGRYFTITSGAPTMMRPVTVAAGGTISVKVAFNAADYALHTDQLNVVSNSAQLTNSIALQGVQVAATASVSNSLPVGVTVTLLPNPMTSRLKVDLSGVSNASVVIYDMTGKQVLSSPIAASEWVWNGTATDGTQLLSGTYLVRLSGTSTEGASFVSTQKIILAR
ncbi:MAG: T9SS type A sorting domain-containing protein [Bacteroidota bacterium]|nr:T9SS type A sorting domain-containing protein [Bacteroidota bacterium]MDP4230517.1 T9SS type A sorting domain-containing protein [Bacteroidota bacterium]MDP4235520.1 T9SS type A sorting domain-containing protein [Bacteroidota bacterium]